MLGIVFRLLANTVGNLLRALSNLFRLMRARRRPVWVRVDVQQPLPARPPRPAIWRRRRPSLASVTRLLDELAEDRFLSGVILRLGPLRGGWARVDSLRAAIRRLQRAGKRVVVHLSSPGMREYAIATTADLITADESGPLALTGLAAEVTFWGGALARAGLSFQAEYRGEYKSFAETLTSSQMSPPHREALEAILDGLYGQLTRQTAESRHIDASTAAERLAGGPYTAQEARRLGLLDAVCYIDELPAYLSVAAERVGTVRDWRSTRILRFRWTPLLQRARRIVVLPLHGTIVDGEGTGALQSTVGDEAANRALDALANDRRVAAVVLHVDSRGGSASASDQIWRRVVKLVEQKPVVAYLDDVAASGGYYLSCAATRIVAQPGTLTGSIGVVAGKPESSALRQRLGFNSVLLARGAAAGMNSTARPYTEDQRRRLAAEVDVMYRQFVERVAKGRRRSLDEIERAARGRVWLGSDAQANGLVDELGDVELAITLARELARRDVREHLNVVDAHVSPRHKGLVATMLGTLTGEWLAETAPGLEALLDDCAAGGDGVLALALDVPTWRRW